MIISKPGFYNECPEKDYHGDPVKGFSLSSDVVKALAMKSPRHAKALHPRLTEQEEKDQPDRPMCIGTAFHKIMLGRGRMIDVLKFDNYLKKDAKEERDASFAAGNVPLLAPDMVEVELMVNATMEQLADLNMSDLFTGGHAEVTMAWREENGVWCRSRPDYLHDDSKKGGHVFIPELKTTIGSAQPEDWSSTCANTGYDYQACLRERGLKHLIPGLKSVETLWVVVEQKPPYGLSLVTMDNQTRAEIGEMIEVAIDAWKVCRETNQWPSYGRATLDAKPWRSMSTELRRQTLIDRTASLEKKGGVLLQ
jgi:hypothetical protein